MDEESPGRMGMPQENTSSGTRNQPEEYDSVGNNQLIDDLNSNMKLIEMKKKSDPAFLRNSYLSNYCRGKYLKCRDKCRLLMEDRLHLCHSVL
jgi:hypothetical protein